MQQRVFRLVGGAAVGIGAAGALLLATDVLDRVARWDVSAYRGLRALAGHPDVSGVAHRVVDLADPVPTAAMMAAICGASLACGRPRHAGGALLLVGGASLTSLALKVALAHPRYQSLLGPQGLAAEAFPSGHATTAMAVGLAGVLVATPRWRLAAAIGAAFYGLAGGLSVVIIGWHYPSDVLGAFLLSGSFGLLSVAALRATDGEPKAHRALTWPFGRPVGGVNGTLVALTGGAAVVALAVTLSEGDKLLSWAAANTSAVVAATGIALLSAVLVYGVAAEANGS